jgi:hypothetical protein
MQFPQFPKISSNFILAAAIFVVLLFSMADMLMLLSYSGQTTTYFAYLNQKVDMLNQSSDNNTYKAQVGEYLKYLDTRITTTSQQLNISLQDSLQEINNLKKSNENLTNRLDALNKSVISINYTGSPVMNCTNTTTTIYVNQTIPTPVTDNRTCRQKLLDLHGLGPYFDVVACCNNVPPVGYSQECCACYQ